MIIYADILFLLNVLICYICLLCTAMIAKMPIRRKRLLLACLPAGIYALSILLPIPFILSLALKIGVCSCIILIAFGKLKPRLFLINTVLFLLLNFVLAGIVLALSAIDSKTFYSNWNISYINISPLMLVLSLVICYVTVVLISGMLERQNRKQSIYRVRIKIGTQEHTCFGFCDTGNNLTEPFSAFPVCVVKKGVIKDFESLSNKRIIPFSSLAGDGLLEAVRGTLILKDGKRMLHTDQVYFAQSTNAFKDMQYDIILHKKIWETECEYETQAFVQHHSL